MKPKTHKGQLTVWKDERGFGFIKPDNGDQDVFLHITGLKNPNRRPQVDDIILYQVTVDNKGKLRASNAVIEGTASQPSPKQLAKTSAKRKRSKKRTKSSSLVWQVLFLSLFPIGGSVHLASITSNFIPLLMYLSMSGLTFLLYAHDKSHARTGEWRIPEKTLHLCELAGGWLGAFIAQRTLRHKSSKNSYQVVFWVIVAFHIMFWSAWLLKYLFN
ncbi:DUF1294 domain-containing protein [Coleofasciculus sp. G2-EDA-02]|uniref:DUF1294 domain-containing protein n=1 Tax=Coleofasciculus sp. G2-EDA-02 TaxID=3069529 RepID=UPI0032F715DE